MRLRFPNWTRFNSEIPNKTERTEASGRKARGRKPGAATGRAKFAPSPVSVPAIDEPPLPLSGGVLHNDVERGCEAIQTLLHDLMPLFATGADMINAVPGLRTNLPFDDIKIDQLIEWIKPLREALAQRQHRNGVDRETQAET